MKTSYTFTKVALVFACVFTVNTNTYAQLEAESPADNLHNLRLRSFNGLEANDILTNNDGEFFIEMNTTDDALRIFDNSPFTVRFGESANAPLSKFEIFHDSGLLNPHIDIHEDSSNDFARINFTSNSSDYWALAGAGGTTDRFNIFYNDGTTGTNLLSVDPTSGVEIENNLRLNDDTNERIRMIGTNNWMSWYNAANTVRQAFIYYFDSANEFRFDNDLNGPITLRTNSTERVRVTGTGDMGIGVLAPTEKLDVNGNIHANAIKLNLGVENSEFINETTGDGVEMSSTSGGENIFFRDAATDDLLTSMNGSTERFGVRIHPTYTSHLLHVSGVPSATSGNGFTIENQSASGANSKWTFYHLSSGNLNLYHAGALRGNFNDATGVYTAVSDRREKSNINGMETMMDKILSLKPSTYSMKGDVSNEVQFGLIAQEVQEVFPEITPVIETTEEGASYEKLGVSYTELVPVLIKGMQEQQAIIEQLKADIEELKNK